VGSISRWTAPALAAIAIVSVGGGTGCKAKGVAGRSQPAKTPIPFQRDADGWAEFWRARSVSPPPPRSFLNDEWKPARVLNLTHGALSDDVARKWILADLRRGTGDAWAANHLRLDIVNADVLGPPGLNGTDQLIVHERAAGAVEVRCRRGSVAAAGVISVPSETRSQIPELTEFVIVLVFRATGEPCTRVLSNGNTETLPVPHSKGELTWQLDTGDFRDDPVIGPLWYQARGWSCKPDGSGELGPLCRLVQPDSPDEQRAGTPR
jgi:hypothetical protein